MSFSRRNALAMVFAGAAITAAAWFLMGGIWSAYAWSDACAVSGILLGILALGRIVATTGFFDHYIFGTKKLVALVTGRQSPVRDMDFHTYTGQKRCCHAVWEPALSAAVYFAISWLLILF